MPVRQLTHPMASGSCPGMGQSFLGRLIPVAPLGTAAGPQHLWAIKASM